MKYIATWLMLTITCSLAAAADSKAEDDWKLRKDKLGIQVYTRKVEGSKYAEVRSTTVLQNVRLASMVALLEDAEACPDWADKCAESYVYERISETESYIYTHNAMPFPIKDRDVLAHVQWSQDTDNYEVVMKSEATTGILDKVRRRLRLTEAKASWRFKPLASGGVRITSDAHINPGSSMPGWITNMLLVDTPYVTMKSFIAEVVKPKYQSATVDFIEEPPPAETQQENDLGS